MHVAFDANFISLLLHKHAKAPSDPATKQALLYCQERIQLLVEDLSKRKAKIVLPWPAMAEFMILAHPDHLQYVDEIKTYANFELVEFGARAAIELTMIFAGTGKSPRKEKDATWAKVKYDRQILAIALASGCGAIYTTDKKLGMLAAKHQIKHLDVFDLPLPPAKQTTFDDMALDISTGKLKEASSGTKLQTKSK